MNALRPSTCWRLPGFRLLGGAALILLLCGQLLSCASKQPPPSKPRPSALEAWDAFWSLQEDASKWSGYSLKASLNLSTPQSKRRITLDMWGNYGLPLRIDLQAGLGTTFALWRVDAEGLLAYYPREHRAFVHRDSLEAAARLGLHLPFSVQEIARLLTGRWQGIVPGEFASAGPLDATRWSYRFPEAAPVNRLILDNEGRMLRLEGEAPYAWSLECTHYERFDGHSLGQHFVLRTERKERSVLRIKKLDLKKEPWPVSSLQIELPPNTMFVPLRGTSSQTSSAHASSASPACT